jgi:hypothetical protein
MGTYDTVALEAEFESLAELEQWQSEFLAAPENAGFIENLDELTERGGTAEVWTLVE